MFIRQAQTSSSTQVATVGTAKPELKANTPKEASGPKDTAATNLTTLTQARQSTPSTSTGFGLGVLKNMGQMSKESRGTVLTGPKEIWEYELSSDPKAKEALNALPQQTRDEINRFALANVVEGTKVDTCMVDCERGERPSPEQAQATGARNGLAKLLANGKLMEKGSHGQSLWSEIKDLESRELADGIDRKSLQRGLLTDTGFFAGELDSPTTTEVNRIIAKEQPADYARTVADLASPEARSSIDGLSLERPKDFSPQKPNERRLSASAELFQSSLDKGAGVNELFRREVVDNPKLGDKYAGLSSDEKAQFQQVYQNSFEVEKLTQPDSLNIPFEKRTPEQTNEVNAFHQLNHKRNAEIQSRHKLGALLVDGKLTNKDSQGSSLLSNLHSINNQEMASEGGEQLEASRVVAELVGQIHDPGTIVQNNKGTCTVTTIEHLMASRQPSEYARIVGDLTSKKGEVTLQDGATVKRDNNLVAEDDSRRTAASRVFQATMMEYGNGDSYDYRNAEDGHVLISTGKFDKNTKGRIQSGLTDNQWERVSDSVLGGKTDVYWGSRKGLTQEDIASLAEDGIDIGGSRETEEKRIAENLVADNPVQVALKWSTDEDDIDAYHALSVTGMDDKHVYLRNPHGSSDAGNDNADRGITREALANETPTTPNQDSMVFGGFGFGGTLQDTRPKVSKELSDGHQGSIRIEKDVFFENLSSVFVTTNSK